MEGRKIVPGSPFSIADRRVRRQREMAEKSRFSHIPDYLDRTSPAAVVLRKCLCGIRFAVESRPCHVPRALFKSVSRLNLSRPPVAVAFLATPPAGLPRVDRPPPAGCGYWKHASDGHAFYTTPEDHENCTGRGVHARRHALRREGARSSSRSSAPWSQLQIPAQRGSARHPAPDGADADRRLRAARRGDVRPRRGHFSRQRATDHAGVRSGARGGGVRIERGDGSSRLRDDPPGHRRQQRAWRASAASATACTPNSETTSCTLPSPVPHCPACSNSSTSCWTRTRRWRRSIANARRPCADRQ